MSNTLASGGQLRPGEQLVSSNQEFRLIYQTDGNLVLYHGEQALWHTHTFGQSAGRCVIQADDGHLVVYDAGKRAVWCSGVWGAQYAGCRLVLSDEGDLVEIDASGREVWRRVGLVASRPGGAPGPATPTTTAAEPSPETPMATPPSPSLRPETPREALCDLLQSCFNEPELRHFVALLPGAPDLAARLPGTTASFAQLVLETVLLLERYGLLAAAFFARLSHERPHRAADIEAVRVLFSA